MKKTMFAAIAALALVSASSAQAVTVSYTDYVTATDGSGKTSAETGNNVFRETFDRIDGTGGTTIDQSLVAVTTVSGGALGYATGSQAGAYAAPANDSTHFAYGPSATSGQTTSEVNFNYSNLLKTLNQGSAQTATLNYFGLYYGSIDTFNDVIFYNAAGQIIQTITGSELIALSLGASAADNTNVYVSLFFTAAEEFTSFSFQTSSIAFEMDNLVVGYQVANPSLVPEPASLALLGLGLLGVGVARRRKQA